MNRSGTPALAVVTIAAWFAIAGTAPAVTIYALVPRGAATSDSAWWTLFTSQFVHVHRLHMLLNVAHLLLLGWWLEPRLRTPRFLAVYLLGGAIAQLAVVLTGDIASGASQSVAALAGAGVTLARTRWQIAALAIVILMIAALDLYSAHTIKIGHAAGFIAGALSNLLRTRAAR